MTGPTPGHRRGAAAPPPAAPPSGLCMCGCGEKTRIATSSNNRYGHRRGQPVRFIVGHNARATGRAPRTIPDDAPPCDAQFVGTCLVCDMPMHASGSRRCSEGHFGVRGRSACPTCYERARADGTLIDLPRRYLSRDELLDEWELLRGQVSFRAFHERVGVSHRTWERAYYRARADGDPRAIRTDLHLTQNARRSA
ncbi:MAG TPA: hypothetical protein VIP28_15425 [Nocardioides sp.]